LATQFLNFDEVRELATIEQIAARLGLPVKQEPGSLRCECPRHGGGKRSLTITLDKLSARNRSKGVFFCNVPPKGGGDRIGLVAHCLEIGQQDAAKWVQEQFGGPVQEKPPKGTFDVDRYIKGLDPNHEALEPLGIAPETLQLFIAGYVSGGRNAKRLAIAMHDPKGDVTGFMGIALSEEDTPRIKLPDGMDARRVLFNAHRVKEGEVKVLQSPLDVIRASEFTDDQHVAFLTEDVTSEQLEMLVSLLDERKCTLVF